MDDRIRELLRQIPSMESLLSEPWVLDFETVLGRPAVKGIFSDIIGELRKSIIQGMEPGIDVEWIRSEALKRVSSHSKRSLRSVVNATGVVIHTNLGRSCLCDAALNAVAECASSYSTLEFDLSTGERGHRNDHVEWLLCQVTGADAAIVVNNNAAAVMLCLSVLVPGKESIVSRGELVEIGGSFRIPDIMSASGTKLVEVGTTNRTHLRDYEKAVNDNTGMILKVHPSNFRIVGFHSEVSREDLASLAREKDLVFMEDLGSGFLLETAAFGLKGEASVMDCILAGVDIVTFSGDKMLGGPQAGIVAGRSQVIDRLRKHPLMRAFRPDKMTLAALEATLREVLAGRLQEIPTLAMISASPETLARKAKGLAKRLKKKHPDFHFTTMEAEDAVGGGSYPEIPLPGYAVSIGHPSFSSGFLKKAFLGYETPVITETKEGQVLLHVRTLLDGDEVLIGRALEGIGARNEESVT
jgi:L-seryl-tRNA(Ser) seleniumtransferase